VLIWRIRRVVEHSHFLSGQKLLDDCRVVSKSVEQSANKSSVFAKIGRASCRERVWNCV
jgi:hypothetical protein